MQHKLFMSTKLFFTFSMLVTLNACVSPATSFVDQLTQTSTADPFASLSDDPIAESTFGSYVAKESVEESDCTDLLAVGDSATFNIDITADGCVYSDPESDTEESEDMTVQHECRGSAQNFVVNSTGEHSIKTCQVSITEVDNLDFSLLESDATQGNFAIDINLIGDCGTAPFSSCHAAGTISLSTIEK